MRDEMKQRTPFGHAKRHGRVACEDDVVDEQPFPFSNFGYASQPSNVIREMLLFFSF
jgi:hypothetical protein